MKSAQTGEPVIDFRNASFCLRDRDGNEKKILDSLNLTVSRGETVVLFGRSGAGKTTALKLINRLLQPTSGEVCVQGRSTLAWDPIELRRRIGYVIQETGLLPHYTVADNVALIPRLERWPPDRVKSRVNELLSLLGLPASDFRRRYPHELSGGQRQRVGLARALAADPAILLMDEPFGALDPLTRAEVRREFQNLQQRLRKTIVIVTHDVHEAVVLGTRIVLMDSGRLTGDFLADAFLASNDPVAAAFANQLRELESLRESDGSPSVRRNDGPR
ncbi:MAG TPA: ATP-binding cassette domain-containing protein [Candidatus Acidoferrales bacterium]|nr:ATP-binding cassette domain-containing protein [Candidatus Acidoferrales bacterium]